MVVTCLLTLTVLHTLNAALTLRWMLHAWRTPEELETTSFPEPDGEPRLSFSLLVPARHEEQVLPHTVGTLLGADHPDFEVVVITGDDDPGTTALAARLAADNPERVRHVIDRHPEKNKPRALNTALDTCRGEVIGVFDAEDVVHPRLLSHVDHALRTRSADVVQGGVQLMNHADSWYALCNCLEYFFWFRSRLHVHARQGFIPLGGNTVFIRAALLREAGGWDGDCLAEDCELGVRLSSRGVRVVVGYHPALVTREETPGTLRALVRQRTRWNQGFLQVLRKGEWRRLATVRQRMLARYVLATPFFQAFTALCMPMVFVTALMDGIPLAAALFAWLPALLMVAMTLFECAGLHDFGREYGRAVRPIQHLTLWWGLPLYSVVLAAAAFRAVWRECRGRNDWELTAHTGAHLHAPDPPVGRPEGHEGS
ncbi:glycosyltransferase family 2 protein [Streptomyces sp. ISL-22]|uniref:glycosyltransferase n=1 Tax=unclassified Streptomyces TaxID=2593676 RepID=UPI001BED210B|nr:MULTISPECIES: glycosyltransferase family 2 protein [unclassified Streptomyces]MBT2420315.1 glycosyltransferase family 2 protein [Streptomyces sp. ISL-24]MBT2433071.1 glycosyltransferase family 2 protein [Streptomyces sp. ISL-22]